MRCGEDFSVVGAPGVWRECDLPKGHEGQHASIPKKAAERPEDEFITLHTRYIDVESEAVRVTRTKDSYDLLRIRRSEIRSFRQFGSDAVQIFTISSGSYLIRETYEELDALLHWQEWS